MEAERRDDRRGRLGEARAATACAASAARCRRATAAAARLQRDRRIDVHVVREGRRALDPRARRVDGVARRHAIRRRELGGRLREQTRHVDDRSRVGAVRFDVEDRDDRTNVGRRHRARDRRQRVAGDDLVGDAAEEHAILAALELHHAVAGRRAVVAGADRRLRDLVDEQDVLVELGARNFEQDAVTDLVHGEHARLRLGLPRHDAVVRLRNGRARLLSATGATAPGASPACRRFAAVGRSAGNVGRRLLRRSGRRLSRCGRLGLGSGRAADRYDGGCGRAQDESGTRSHIHPASEEREGTVGGGGMSARQLDRVLLTRVERVDAGFRWDDRAHCPRSTSIGSARDARRAGT